MGNCCQSTPTQGSTVKTQPQKPLKEGPTTKVKETPALVPTTPDAASKEPLAASKEPLAAAPTDDNKDSKARTGARRNKVNSTKVPEKPIDDKIYMKFVADSQDSEDSEANPFEWKLMQYGKFHTVMVLNGMMVDDKEYDLDHSEEEQERLGTGELSTAVETHLGWNIQYGIDREAASPIYIVVNGVHMKDMPVACTEMNTPSHCRSEEHKVYNETQKCHCFEFFKDSDKSVCIVEQRAKDETIVIALNKQIERFSGVSFDDTSVLPVTLVDDEAGVKATVDFDSEIQEYVLDIDGQPFESLVYLASDHNPDNKEVKVITANLEVNDHQLMGHYWYHENAAKTQEWQPALTQFAIYECVPEEEPITSIVLSDVRDSNASVVNELIGLLLIQQNIAETGLEKLQFSGWRHISGLLDASVLQSLAAKCGANSTVKIYGMDKLDKENLQIINQFKASLSVTE